MIAYTLFENAVLFTIFTVCLWSLTGRIAPQWRAGLQSSVAIRLASSKASPRLRRLGLRLIPQVVDQSCGSACSRCGACGTGDANRHVAR